MYKLEVKLKQHTPLIHFQHDQEGATLRASEVKPKLDRYLQIKGIAVPKYKMKIYSESLSQTPTQERGGNGRMRNVAPSFFGEDKSLVIADSTIMTIVVQEGDWTIFYNYLSDFFLDNNFGTRQSKGYGSFTVSSIDSVVPTNVAPTQYVSFFNVRGTYVEALKKIELLYKTLRSGINGPQENSLYFKSLMFSFAATWNCHWDKRNIKQHFLPNRLNEQIEQFPNLEPLSFVPKTKDELVFDTYTEEDGEFDFRDLLGFSTNEKWSYYNMQISKKFEGGERYKSPILFKPICEGNQWKIYVLAQEVVQSLLNSKVSVKKGNQSMTMKLFPDFSIFEFLRFAFTEEEILPHFGNITDINPGLQRKKEHQRDSILAMYKDLRKNFREEL